MPKNITEYARRATAMMEEHVDSEYREAMTRVVPTGRRLIGVRVPAIRECARTFAAEYGDIGAEGALALMDHFSRDGCREEMLFGIFLLVRFGRRLAKAPLADEVWGRLDGWFDAVDNWETCDQLAKVAGPIVAADPVKLQALGAWTRSEGRWRRRFTMAVAVALNQHGNTDAAAALRLCAPLMNEPDADVAKAVGWALREATKSDPGAVYAFMKKWKGKAQRRILREGSEKLTDAQREEVLG